MPWNNQPQYPQNGGSLAAYCVAMYCALRVLHASDLRNNTGLADVY